VITDTDFDLFKLWVMQLLSDTAIFICWLKRLGVNLASGLGHLGVGLTLDKLADVSALVLWVSA